MKAIHAHKSLRIGLSKAEEMAFELKAIRLAGATRVILGIVSEMSTYACFLKETSAL